MSTLVWFEKSPMHTWGLRMQSNNKPTVEDFVYNQVVPTCEKFDCKYFIQNFQVRDFGVSYAFVEFFGEASEEKILSVVEEIEKKYAHGYHNGEILCESPSIGLLKELKLI